MIWTIYTEQCKISASAGSSYGGALSNVFCLTWPFCVHIISCDGARLGGVLCYEVVPTGPVMPDCAHDTPFNIAPLFICGINCSAAVRFRSNPSNFFGKQYWPSQRVGGMQIVLADNLNAEKSCQVFAYAVYDKHHLSEENTFLNYVSWWSTLVSKEFTTSESRAFWM